ncbi:uncharacterized protein LOC119068035 isoform X2 [Bradysia coprophila]|uniref:uncharacterized protein LOC119068035 isoform X2 n=1 Tax=Bradysia coprophila TaxID=38358 RepID=UPI00187D7BA4|nr:uncharacterized protein LOC119068035 isoform X2 [Bradysia coprophila]
MERISYDFSSSDEDMSSSCSDETANRGNTTNKTDKDEESTDKIQNVVYKLVNREQTGVFSNHQRIKSKQQAYSTVPNRLSFRLKDIVPYCYLKGHVFMGLTACGQFLLSYKVTFDAEQSVNTYNFFETYKYELFFWIYRPHNLLSKYFNVCIFDDHGVDNLKVVSISQWMSNPRILIVHGAGECDNEDSYISVVSVPKLGCLDCKKIHEELNSEPLEGRQIYSELCIKCNLTVHSKYSRCESDPIFDPKINLNCPMRIVLITNGLIHMLNIELELNKPIKMCSNSLDIAYINRLDGNRDDHGSDEGMPAVSVDADEKLSTILPEKSNALPSAKNKPVEPKQTENIVARIIADFAECETDYPTQGKHVEKSPKVPNKFFEELVITCSGNSTADPATSSKTTGNRVRLLNHRNNPIYTKTLNPTRNGITTVDLQGSSTATATTNKAMDKAAKAYEFSEDNEKCEKISTFRKRRLADKKYEFSEDNSENIIPFAKLRSNRQMTFRSNPYSSPNSQNTGFISPSHTNFDIVHTHRASPSCGFRSPCGSPVSNRHIMSPPVRASSLYGRSPTYTKSFSSPRLLGRRTYFDQMDSPLQLLSPRSDEFEVLKTIQPMNGVKQTNVDVTNYGFISGNVDKLESEKPSCSKKLVRRFVEVDDATSVITSEEDDCISPGYHATLPVEVHGACYCDMQMISKSSYQTLKCPVVVITQHTFDLEALTYHITNYLCSLNNKQYGFFYDWAFEPINVCSLSSSLTSIIIVHFTARDLISTNTKECINCTSNQNLDCVFHRKHFESRTLFTWSMENGDWQVLDYGELIEVSPTMAYKRNSSELNSVVKKLAADLSADVSKRDICYNLRVLDSCTNKSKEILRDQHNSIEFYRNSNKPTNMFPSYSDSDE